MRYLVMHCNPVESVELAAFVDKNLAIGWCGYQVKGEKEYCDEDTDNGNNHHWYEVYDQKDVNEDNPLGEMVYETERYYND